mmetsp:Transcript_43886/g.109922  ORF Transcript_43886/g.109922 Transcript_43886/m.109922 type:complete len:252 (+) Transcript_43886:2988-3743(+)
MPKGSLALDESITFSLDLIASLVPLWTCMSAPSSSSTLSACVLLCVCRDKWLCFRFAIILATTIPLIAAPVKEPELPPLTVRGTEAKGFLMLLAPGLAPPTLFVPAVLLLVLAEEALEFCRRMGDSGFSGFPDMAPRGAEARRSRSASYLPLTATSLLVRQPTPLPAAHLGSCCFSIPIPYPLPLAMRGAPRGARLCCCAAPSHPSGGRSAPRTRRITIAPTGHHHLRTLLNTGPSAPPQRQPLPPRCSQV